MFLLKLADFVNLCIQCGMLFRYLHGHQNISKWYAALFHLSFIMKMSGNNKMLKEWEFSTVKASSAMTS